MRATRTTDRSTAIALLIALAAFTLPATAARGRTPAGGPGADSGADPHADSSADSHADSGADPHADSSADSHADSSAARAIDVDVKRIAVGGADLVIDLEIANLIDPATEETLARGVPVTLILDIEIWRERSAWFDRLEASRHLAYKLQLDAWDEVYVVRDAEGRQEIFLDLDEARGALEDRPALPIAPLTTIEPESSYYIVVAAALKPLTVEDVEELEGWLSGEIKSGRARDVGLLGLPKALFGVVMDMTGLGDRNDVKRTPSFRRGDVVDAE